ncbi:dual specificity protein phosphatase 10-like isoform X2 [Dysidea avara]|uniref:dual specificity protein phosphatase 10-like isoform X2 n=1 Tax=Dysidea avara TaxID=196820 RepID=UPI0033303E77
MSNIHAPKFTVETIQPHDLAKDLHAQQDYVLLDCRPMFAFNTRHISGKLSLADLVTTEQGKEKFRQALGQPLVVYDECTVDPNKESPSQTLMLVLKSLAKDGMKPFVLKGGLSEFGVLHPSLCEISIPSKSASVDVPFPSTPCQREDVLAWQRAKPIAVLSHLVLGNEKDASSMDTIKHFNISYVLNITAKCPNYFETDRNFKYKRISANDTGSQKLIDHFEEAFHFIEEARTNNKVVLVHCMAGISRSVTITIAYLMKFHRMSMNRAYHYLKDMRPAISPNLNFMGQLVEFERSLELGNDQHSPQVTTSDPLVATTTSSPDVMTPSKGVSPGVKYTTQRSDPILEAYQLTPSQVIPEYAAMEPTDVLSSSASSEQGGLSSSSSFGSSHGNPFFLKGPLKKKKPSKSSVVDEPKVPPTESSDTSAVEQTFQKLEITGVKINIADKIKKFENTS